ncbi:MAG: putative glycosyltransferase, family 2, partial [Variovorax sp.]|nr:putative glycosyltransferase, family 2 [Variovorax sp.]
QGEGPMELVIACSGHRKASVTAAVKNLSNLGIRTSLVFCEEGCSLVGAEAKALGAATGDFVGFISAGDRLAPRALDTVRLALGACADAVAIYSDEAWLDSAGVRSMPRFKTAWDPDAQLGFDLLGRLCLMRRSVVLESGGLRESFGSAAHYDLHCRVTCGRAAHHVRHVPAVLYHRKAPTTMGRVQLARAVEVYAAQARLASRETVAHLLGESVEVAAAPLAAFINRVKWPLPQPAPLVSILVPTRDRAAMLRNCVRGVLQETDYPSIELLILDNDSVEQETQEFFDELSEDDRVRVIPMPGPFNYSRINNQGAMAAHGEVIVLMNNDVEILDAVWLHDMVALALRPEIGCVGAKLLYEDGRIQHVGIVLQEGPLAMHAFRLHAQTDLGHEGQLAALRSYVAVTAACLAMRRDVFLEVNGFDEEKLQIAYNDVDLCLRVGDAGYRNVCTPFAPLIHLENASRGPNESPVKALQDKNELDCLVQRWPDVFRCDPFRNPHLLFDWKSGMKMTDRPVPATDLADASP